MAQIEKTVFISYRRSDVYTALAVYENLKNQGYNIFFDYRSIASGDFEQVISSNIRARAHFLLILTPTALDRCNEPGDWLRREIELAIDEKRNIVPLFFKGFHFGASSKSGVSKWLPFNKPDVLTGKLKDLTRYNGLNVHEDYFDEAMVRLRTDYLNKPLDTVLHPVSTEVQKVVEEEKSAADEAIKQIEDAKESEKPVEEKPEKGAELEELKSQAIRLELKGDFWNAQQAYYKIKKIDPSFPRVDVKIRELERELERKMQHQHLPRKSLGPSKAASEKGITWRLVVGGLVSLTLILCTSGVVFLNNLPSAFPELPPTSRPIITETSKPAATRTPKLEVTNTPSPTNTPIPPTQDLSILQGEPVSEWKGIPVMPDAIQGEERRYVLGPYYIFSVDASRLEVFDYYEEKMLELNWVSTEVHFILGDDVDGYYKSRENDIMLLNITFKKQDTLSIVTLYIQYRPK